MTNLINILAEAPSSVVVQTSILLSSVNITQDNATNNETTDISETIQTEEFRVQARRQKAYSAALGKGGDVSRTSRRRNLRTAAVQSRPLSSNQTVNALINSAVTIGVTSADSTWSDNSDTEDNAGTVEDFNSATIQNSQSGRRDSFKWDSDEDEHGPYSLLHCHFVDYMM